MTTHRGDAPESPVSATSLISFPPFSRSRRISVVDIWWSCAETHLMNANRRGRVVAGHDVNAYLARHVPITQAMGIRLRSFDAAGVTMTAPLKPNINDKGIAFGGTLASILALSGWALADLVLREAGEAADVLIAVAVAVAAAGGGSPDCRPLSVTASGGAVRVSDGLPAARAHLEAGGVHRNKSRPGRPLPRHLRRPPPRAPAPWD